MPASAARSRCDVRNHYFSSGATKFEPQCWQTHNASGEEAPLDWAHTLAALYRVRCNLFHGEKSAHSEMDQRVVHAALKVLVDFLDEAEYLR